MKATPKEWKQVADWCYKNRVSPYQTFWYDTALKEIRKLNKSKDIQ